MSFGKNLQHLRRMCGEITQEALAEKLKVSRQTVSKWELDESTPEMDKAIELCGLFNCSLDNLFREEMGVCDDAYTNLRVETVPGFRYVTHAVISSDPEEDAIGRLLSIARENGVEHPFNKLKDVRMGFNQFYLRIGKISLFLGFWCRRNL